MRLRHHAPACWCWLVVGTGCASPGPGAAVIAPTTPPLARAPSGEAAPAGSGESSGVLEACGKPWTVDVIGGGAQVVVVCPHDVRRASLDESSVFERSLSPALDPARDRVCGCAGRLHPPPFVDLVFKAHPADGRVTVEAKADEDSDPQLAPPFVACVGTVTATFDALRSDACPDGPPSLVYPVRLELDVARTQDPEGTSASRK